MTTTDNTTPITFDTSFDSPAATTATVAPLAITPADAERTRLRHDIMQCCLANELTITADLWFRLIFLSDAGLRCVARELNIK